MIHRRPVALVACVLSAVAVLAAAAADLKVSAKTSDGRVLASFTAGEHWTPTVREQLQTGNAVTFDYQAELRRPSTLWFDDVLARTSVTLAAKLDTLIGGFKVTRQRDGKIVRVNTDGSIPKDNPFVGKEGVRPEIWSFGHRNVQAATLNPATGELWEVEHGTRGGDELNVSRKGKDYGWPTIAYGIEYQGGPINGGIQQKEGMEQPVYYWDPVIAPSGMIFYMGELFSGWRDSILIGSLTPGLLVRLVMKNGQVAQEERYLGDLRERIRDVRQAPDGSVFLLTDARNGQILRITPGAKR